MRPTLSLLRYGSASSYSRSTLARLTLASETRARALTALSSAGASQDGSAAVPSLAAPPPPQLSRPRPALTSRPAPGGGSRGAFTLPCTKVVIYYCPSQASSAGVRRWLEREVKTWAEQYPSVEWVVSPRKAKHPVLIAEYANGRSKEVCVRNLEVDGVSKKFQVLLDSSGRKTASLKRRPVESINESARGIWSPLHTAERKVL
ncbi:39S ribosomal protein L51, mitochondrial [Tilletia horrida]|nr:39S ribosomal protein L51, mitochondrial [Tilletia horrida]